MDKELVKEIIASGSAFLTSVAVVAKTTGEHLYGVIVRQQLIDGISILISIGMFFLLNIITLITINNCGKGKSSDTKEDLFYLFLFFIFAYLILSIILVDPIQKILNPEYFAIKFIIESVKK
mgnify:FL=1